MQSTLESSIFRQLKAIVAVAIVAALAFPNSSRAAPERSKIGLLACDISPGIGLIVSSKKNLTCLFLPSQAGTREVYSGTISKFGLDIGATAEGEMIWTVYSTGKKRFGALAGHYGGVSAEATLVGGLGANLLIGGSDRAVTLQPVSVQGLTGLNLAVGVAEIELRPAR
jgi:hypothetical protein